MSSAEAAKLLDLPPGAAPAQVEARFAELRAKLEEKIAKAPTPGLRDKYRASLTLVTSAFETLTLATDAADLPSLRRTTPTGSPQTAASPAPVAGVPPPRTPASTPASAAPAAPGWFEVALMHLTGFVKFCLGLVLCFVVFALSIAALKAIHLDEVIQTVVGIIALVITLLLSVWFWRRSVRRARQRVAEGKSNKVEHIIASSLSGLAVLGVALAFAILENQRRAYQAETRERTLGDLRREAGDIEQRLAGYEKLVAAAEAKQRELERSLTSLRPADPAEARKGRLTVRAWGVYSRYLRSALTRHPAPAALRQRMETVLKAVEQPPAELRQLQDLVNAHYSSELTNIDEGELRRLLERQDLAPDPKFYLGVDEARKAAEAGDALAMWQLYEAYQRGTAAGLDFDPAARIQWLRRAAEKGYPDAMVALGNEYANAQPELKAGSFTEKITVLPKDPALALSWYRKAAEAGSPWGMATLSEILLEGRDTPKDPAGAYAWAQRAVEITDRYGYGMRLLGDCYASGAGVPADEKAAIEWWTKAARENEWFAQQALKKRNLSW